MDAKLDASIDVTTSEESDRAPTAAAAGKHTPSRRFGTADPDRIAYYEANGWRAYYDRKWIRLLRLMVALNQQQFGIPFPKSLLGAYYVTRGSIAWVPLDHDEAVIIGYFRKFYALARRYSGLRYDPDRAAALELRYYDVHRQLVGQTDKTEFIQAMTALHAELFGLTEEQAAESARWRVEANNTVDRITQKQSIDVEADWARVEECLRQCYRSIQRQLAS